MTKIVYNGCFGGFGVSEKGMKRYAELKGFPIYVEKSGQLSNIYWTVPENERVVIPEDWTEVSIEERGKINEKYHDQTISDTDFDRTDPILVQVVEELGGDANGWSAELMICDLPSGTKYIIDEYDGNETVRTPDDFSWRIA